MVILIEMMLEVLIGVPFMEVDKLADEVTKFTTNTSGATWWLNL